MMSPIEPMTSLLAKDDLKAKDYVDCIWPFGIDTTMTALTTFSVPKVSKGVPSNGNVYRESGNGAYNCHSNGVPQFGISSTPSEVHNGNTDATVFDFEAQNFAAKAMGEVPFFANGSSLAAPKSSQIHVTPQKSHTPSLAESLSPETMNEDTNDSSQTSSPVISYTSLSSLNVSSEWGHSSKQATPPDAFIHESSPTSALSSPQSLHRAPFITNMDPQPRSIVPIQRTASSSMSSDSLSTMSSAASASNSTNLKMKPPRRRRIRSTVPADGLIFKSKSLLNKRGSSCFPIGAYVVRLCDYSDDLTTFGNVVWNVTNHNLLQRWDFCMRNNEYTVFKSTDRYTRWLPQFPDEYILVDDIIAISRDAMTAVLLPLPDEIIASRCKRNEQRIAHGLPPPMPIFRPRMAVPIAHDQM